MQPEDSKMPSVQEIQYLQALQAIVQQLARISAELASIRTAIQSRS
jgi:hypothetical protein